MKHDLEHFKGVLRGPLTWGELVYIIGTLRRMKEEWELSFGVPRLRTAKEHLSLTNDYFTAIMAYGTKPQRALANRLRKWGWIMGEDTQWLKDWAADYLGYDGIVPVERISLEEAKRRYTWVLNDPVGIPIATHVPPPTSEGAE